MCVPWNRSGRRILQRYPGSFLETLNYALCETLRKKKKKIGCLVSGRYAAMQTTPVGRAILRCAVRGTRVRLSADH